MQIIKLGEKLNTPIVLCLGFFGTMHVGHVELLNRAKNRARMTNSKVALFTFSNNHLSVLKRDDDVVYTYEERLSLYESLGVDYVITSLFDDDFKKLKGNDFLSSLLQYDLNGGVFCGFDYCCGSDRLNASDVRSFLKRNNDVPVYIVEQIDVNGEKASTSLIKKYLTSNLIDNVNALLSEPFFIIGRVEHGRGVGKMLGFPTANISAPAQKLLPTGVFAAKIVIDDKTYFSIVNIGNMPTFGIQNRSVEIHVIDYDGDLYDRTLKVSLVKYIRKIVKFKSGEELSKQLRRDREAALYD